MHSNWSSATLLLALALIALGLLGCNQSDPRPNPAGWKLNPIVVHGYHLYDSVTGAPFHAKGIAFPNMGDDVPPWISALHRIKKESPSINLVRIYWLPACALKSDCFAPFMQEADSLGVYVLVPGTGVDWGYLPIDLNVFGGKDATADKCYKEGNVLGFGKAVVQFLNYPNVLAIVIGNEFDQKHEIVPFLGVIKAYARDLKRHMELCDSDPKSPTRQTMRQIPLLYANSDDRGDLAVKPKADYLFCGSADVSIDIFGLNVERWCDSKNGPVEYAAINKFVSEARYPGGFIFSEMGCGRFQGLYNGTRLWDQIPDIFNNYGAVDGFVGYAYYGNQKFNMFDAPKSDATLLPDGKNFFDATNKVGKEPNVPPSIPTTPSCPTAILGTPIQPYTSVKRYGDDDPTVCPKPTQPYQPSSTDKEPVLQNGEADLALTVQV